MSRLIEILSRGGYVSGEAISRELGISRAAVWKRVEALRGEGYGDMITETINANNLSAFVKEQIAENGDALPEWLDGLVSVFEKTTVGVRKAARSERKSI